MKLTNINLPHHITVDAVVRQKLDYILGSTYDKEFTGFCHAEKREDGEYHISDIFFPRQDNAATTTECDSEDVIALMKEGFDISLGSGHAHSHVNMEVFASSTDKKDILERANDSGFNVSIIVNKKGKIFGHIADMELGVYIEDCDVFTTYPFTTEQMETYIMNSIKESDCIEDIRELAYMDEDDFMKEFFPLSKENQDFLQTVVKERFKNAYTPYSSNVAANKKKESNVKMEVVPLDTCGYGYDDHASWQSEMPEEAEDWFSTNELMIIEGAWYKGTASLTNEEFYLIEECKERFPNYSPY